MIAMNKYFCFLLSMLFAVSGCAGETSPDLMTYNGIRQSSQGVGAYQTVRLMNEGDRAAWENFYRHVADGDEAWLQLVPSILGGADAGWTGSIIVALAEALPRNPEGVLALEGSLVSMKYVCSVPFVEPEDKFIDAYAASVRKALAGIDEVYFEQDKRICLLRLNETMQKFEERRKGEYNFK